MIATQYEIEQHANGIRNSRRITGARLVYTDDWSTPEAILSALGPFDLDPCAGRTRYAKRNIFLPKDGLKVRWQGRVWLNPPYSTVHAWLERFARHGDGIALVNARPETAWFQRFAAGSSGLLFLKGRINFLLPDNVRRHPPVGSVLVAYGERNLIALRHSGLAGLLMVHSEG